MICDMVVQLALPGQRKDVLPSLEQGQALSYEHAR